jgi:hypothetical protein
MGRKQSRAQLYRAIPLRRSSAAVQVLLSCGDDNGHMDLMMLAHLLRLRGNMRARERWTRVDLERHQAARLDELLTFARARSPFYPTASCMPGSRTRRWIRCRSSPRRCSWSTSTMW